MDFAKIIGLSVLVGFVGAGFVWYGWGLAQNARAMLTERAGRKREEAQSAAKEKREALEAGKGAGPGAGQP